MVHQLWNWSTCPKLCQMGCHSSQGACAGWSQLQWGCYLQHSWIFSNVKDTEVCSGWRCWVFHGLSENARWLEHIRSLIGVGLHNIHSRWCRRWWKWILNVSKTFIHWPKVPWSHTECCMNFHVTGTLNSFSVPKKCCFLVIWLLGCVPSSPLLPLIQPPTHTGVQCPFHSGFIVVYMEHEDFCEIHQIAMWEFFAVKSDLLKKHIPIAQGQWVLNACIKLACCSCRWQDKSASYHNIDTPSSSRARST